MMLKYLDFLSPPITFYHKGYLSHPSITSGIISIFSFLIIIIFAVYFSLDIIKRRNPTTFYYNRFIEDAGIYAINSSYLFHFISIGLESNNYTHDGLDFTSFRVIGLDTYVPPYLESRNLSAFNHWLYGKCDKEKDINGIQDLVKYKFFEKSACIRKFFDAKEQKYYDIDHQKFRWPIISHGTYHSNYSFYSIILETCKEETLQIIEDNDIHCKSIDKIYETMGSLAMAHLYYIDYYVDPLNYKSPNTKFFNIIENSIQKSSYPMNHLNFQSALIKTHNGLIFDHIEEDKAYIYERNDVFTFSNNDTGIHTIYYFWLKNSEHYYERNYKRIQDLISDIGGINQFITFVAFYINYLYNKYILLSDTEDLLFTSINSNTEKNLKSKHIKEKEKIKNKFQNIVNNEINNDKNRNSDLEKHNSNKLNDKTNNKSENLKINILNNEFENDLSKKELPEEHIESINSIRRNINTERKTFLSFVIFKLSFSKKNSFYKVYENFRIKIMSEEHLIRNHLNIFNLLKLVGRKRSFRKNSIHLRDLIKLI